MELSTKLLLRLWLEMTERASGAAAPLRAAWIDALGRGLDDLQDIPSGSPSMILSQEDLKPLS